MHRDYLGTEMRPEEWLLIERPDGEAEPAKYFLSTAPEEATLAQMVFACKMRWRIERDYQELKREFELGQRTNPAAGRAMHAGSAYNIFSARLQKLKL